MKLMPKSIQQLIEENPDKFSEFLRLERLHSQRYCVLAEREQDKNENMAKLKAYDEFFGFERSSSMRRNGIEKSHWER